MIRSRASWIASTPIGRPRSVFASVARYAKAFTSHGCPSVNRHTSDRAGSVHAWPVSSVCWASRLPVSSGEKSPRRSDSALMLKALPPVIGALSALAWMR